MRVVIAGGGTAGHVNPALAVAEQLSDSDLLFVGTQRGAEARLVPGAGHRLSTIEVHGFDRARPHTFPVTAVRAAGAVRASRSILRAHRPDVVVGMGGYVSLPVSLAARTLSIPIVLHEQNIILGLANRVAKGFASRVAVSFEETLTGLGGKGVHTGNPISSSLADLDRRAGRDAAYRELGLDPARRTLLVFGGSLGARRLNQAAIGLARAWAGRDDVQVLHICGRDHLDRLRSELEALGSARGYRLVGYLDGMASAYCVADLAVCRGGATTVAELCALGVPAVIVPYPFHRDKQQEKHARVLAEAGAAKVLDDASTSTASVAAIAESLLDDPDILDSMSTAARALGKPRAAAELAAVVSEVAS